VAANVARTLGLLGADVALFSVVGGDDPGRLLRAIVERDGVDAAGVEVTTGRTGTYLAVLDADGSLVVGAADLAVLEQRDAAWGRDVARRAADRRLWVVDANVPAPTLVGLLEHLPDEATVLADPVSVSKSERLAPVLGFIDVVFPDQAEAAALAGSPGAEPAETATRIVGMGAGSVVMSQGSRGVLVADAAGTAVHPAIPPDRVVDVTGAGDALVAGYAYGLAYGVDPVATALAAASLTVESPGSVRADLTPAMLGSRLP
jgi:pseudouridine kinase